MDNTERFVTLNDKIIKDAEDKITASVNRMVIQLAEHLWSHRSKVPDEMSHYHLQQMASMNDALDHIAELMGATHPKPPKVNHAYYGEYEKIKELKDYLAEKKKTYMALAAKLEIDG